MKEEISKILVKWNMPTRQVAINELVELFNKKMKEEFNRGSVEGIDIFMQMQKTLIENRKNKD